MTLRFLSRARRTGLVLAAASLAVACQRDTDPTVNDLGPRAFVRVINAVPDTGAMDYRFVDQVENPVELGLGFRFASAYVGTAAGERTFRAFAASQNPTVVFGAPIIDRRVTLAANTYYTFLHVGLANTTGGTGDSIIVLVDTLPASSIAGIAIRGVHAIPAVGGVNVFTTRNVTAALPATPAFSNLTYGRTTGYITLPAIQDSIAARVQVAAAPATVLSALAQFGAAGTTAVNPIGGSRIAGTSMSVVAFPAGLGPRATGAAVNPSLVWFLDGNPPETVPRLRP